MIEKIITPNCQFPTVTE